MQLTDHDGGKFVLLRLSIFLLVFFITPTTETEVEGTYMNAKNFSIIDKNF